MNLDYLDLEVVSWVITVIFGIVIFVATRFAWVSLKNGTNPSYVEYAPSLLTSLGIFGTFVGIVIGLWNFDPKHIDSSIELLLAGLKTAFFTSLFGMFASILFKKLETSYLDKQSIKRDAEVSEGEIGPKEIFGVMRRQQDSMIMMLKAIGADNDHTMIGEIQLLGKSIGGDGDRSMVSQLQLLRTDINDFKNGTLRRQDTFEEKLWVELKNFSEMMSKSATQQVIEALKQVIVEFNEKLTEQFGDNFKRLDESVKKLVEWQSQYMRQLDEMSIQYAEGVKAIDATRVAVEVIQNETASIPTNMQALAGVLEVNQHQIKELTSHLETFVAMRDQAIVAVPEIQKKLEEVGRQLHDGAERVNQVLIEGSDQFKLSVQHTNDSMMEAGKNVATQSEIISKELTDAFLLLESNTERIRTGVTSTVSAVMQNLEVSAKALTSENQELVSSMTSEMQKVLKSAIDNVENSRAATLQSIETINQSIVQNASHTLGGVEKQVQDAVTRTNDAVNAQLSNLDQALSRQLNAALQELGGALGTIATHLVDTYQQRSSEPSRISA